MKKFVTIFMLSFMLFSITAVSQNYVSTEPANKNAILEEFTGVRCPNCPAGHQVAAGILQNNPGRAFMAGYHPFNSSYTTPYAGDPDFRRHHPDSLYMTPWCGSSRFMPSAFINRRIWNGDRLQSRGVWASYTDQILTEASPVNVGMGSTYNDQTNMLEVTVEIYFTSSLTQQSTLNVVLCESELIAQQSGGGTSYVHKHVFRETFTAQWGDIIPGLTNQGTLVVMEYSFDNTTAQYIMENCDLTAFVVDYSNDEIISGVGVAAGDYTRIPPTAEFAASDTLIGTGESVSFTDESLGVPTAWYWEFEGGDPPSATDRIPPEIYYWLYGDYDVSLTVTNDLGESTIIKEDLIHVGGVGMSELSNDIDFTISPNPANNFVRVVFENPPDASKQKMILISSTGKMIKEIRLSNNTRNITIDISDLPAGIYYISVQAGGNILSKSLVKNRMGL